MSSPSLSSGGKNIEILQHWAAEGKDPLVSLIEDFQRTNGGVTFDNHSRHVSSLRLTVKSQILLEDPPDLWVEWPGKNLQMAVDTGVTADITNVWEESGLEQHFAPTAQEAARFDGQYRCLPTNMYRINNLFYNVEYVERAGVDVESMNSPAGFLEGVKALDDEIDVPALVLNARDPFGPLQLWETLVIADGGPECYEELLAGHGERHRGTIRNGVEMLDELLEYVPDDASFTGSGETDEMIVRGEGALSHNGGWALGRLKDAEGFEYGTDWGYSPFPGTDDVFQLNMDAVVPAAHVEGDELIGEFLGHLASKESIERINDTLGSIPPRNDVDVGNLHPVTREMYDSLGSTRAQVHSIAHGLGVSPEALIELKNATASFIENRDVEAMTQNVVDAL